MTNADKIRAMTDEELAEWIAHPKIAYCQYDICNGETDCSMCALQWLKQEDNTMFYPQVEGITPTVIHTQEGKINV